MVYLPVLFGDCEAHWRLCTHTLIPGVCCIWTQDIPMQLLRKFFSSPRMHSSTPQLMFHEFGWPTIRTLAGRLSRPSRLKRIGRLRHCSISGSDETRPNISSFWQYKRKGTWMRKSGIITCPAHLSRILYAPVRINNSWAPCLQLPGHSCSVRRAAVCSLGEFKKCASQTISCFESCFRRRTKGETNFSVLFSTKHFLASHQECLLFLNSSKLLWRCTFSTLPGAVLKDLLLNTVLLDHFATRLLRFLFSSISSTQAITCLSKNGGLVGHWDTGPLTRAAGFPGKSIPSVSDGTLRFGCQGHSFS